jgi:hypothetical protein
MHQPTPSDEAERTTRSPRKRLRPPSADAPQPGHRFLGPSARIWTVQTITTRGDRIVLTTPTPEGDSGAIVDHLAVARMIPLPIAPSSPDDTPATPGDSPTSWYHRNAIDDDPGIQAILQTAAGVAHDDDIANQAVAP